MEVLARHAEQAAWAAEADLAERQAEWDANAEARARAHAENARVTQERLQAITDAAEEDRRRAQVHRDLIRSVPGFATNIQALEISTPTTSEEERDIGPVATLWHKLDEADKAMDEYDIVDPNTLRELTQLRARIEILAQDYHCIPDLPAYVQMGKEIIHAAHDFLSACEDLDEERASGESRAALASQGTRLLAAIAAGVDWAVVYFDPEKGTWLCQWLCDYSEDFVHSVECCLIHISDQDIPTELHNVLAYAETPQMMSDYIATRVQRARPVTDYL